MAHKDACKYQVCQFVGKLISDGGLSLRAAAKKAQAESDGIPAGTICRWWADAKRETGECFNNETPQEQQTNQEDRVDSVAASNDRWPRQRILEVMESRVSDGESIREAASNVAAESGWRPNGVRNAYAKNKEKANQQSDACFAWQFAEMAIMQLERIQSDDQDRVSALIKVRDWINKQEGM